MSIQKIELQADQLIHTELFNLNHRGVFSMYKSRSFIGCTCGLSRRIYDADAHNIDDAFRYTVQLSEQLL